MKKIVTIALSILTLSAFAQNVKEPGFVGQIAYVNGNGSTEMLEKVVTSVTLATKGTVAGYNVAANTPNSSVQLSGQQLQFVVKAKDNSSDPSTIIQLYEMKSEKKKRSFNLATQKVGLRTETTTATSLPFQAEKYGESSYLITVKGLAPGEYAFIYDKPVQIIHGTQVTLSCFGVK